jgi:hypothetical protein
LKSAWDLLSLNHEKLAFGLLRWYTLHLVVLSTDGKSEVIAGEVTVHTAQLLSQDHENSKKDWRGYGCARHGNLGQMWMC